MTWVELSEAFEDNDLAWLVNEPGLYTRYSACYTDYCLIQANFEAIPYFFESHGLEEGTHYRLCDGGGRYEVNMSHPEVVKVVAELESDLRAYPCLDEGRMSELELEREFEFYEEIADEWAVDEPVRSAFIRNLALHDYNKDGPRYWGGLYFDNPKTVVKALSKAYTEAGKGFQYYGDAAAYDAMLKYSRKLTPAEVARLKWLREAR